MLATAQDSELDRGATSVGAGAERFCALTRTLLPVSDMIRFVVGPAGEAVPDVKRKLPGRGIWITARRASIEEAVKRNVFARGFKRDLKVAPGLADETDRLLARAALDALAMAGKAGGAIGGFAKVEAALGHGEVLALIHASDAAEDGKRKLMAAIRRARTEESGEIAVISFFSGTELDLALNRPNVVHAALLAGPGSETFLARVKRLERFRTGNLPDAVSANAPADGALELNAPADGAQGNSTE
ncbi:MAG: RNA-binding protein [Pseudolabrys sp.]|nr:RNA-binding protein [Pseudolabrys sp.]MDP2294403.1 RNA-binding protein [Pseudolabrys sp.]